MDIQTIYSLLIKDILKFYHSGAFLVIKFLLAVYVLVLIYNLVLLLVQRGLAGNFRQIVSGMNIPAGLTTKKGKLRGRWDKVRRRLDTGNESEYKVAIIEADNIINDLIAGMGYKGKNPGERLENIPAEQLDHLDEIKEAHGIRNRVIHEEDFSVSREEAGEILGKYEHFLRHFEVLN